MSGPTVGELFAGAGGIGLALKAIWPETRIAWVSDICKVNKDGSVGHTDPHRGPCAVLENRFPDAPNLGDVTRIDWANVEPVDIITGGSPCQDLSHAGKRMGMKKGTRSGLWASMLEGIAALRPALVIWENVRGAYSAEADSAMEPCAGCMGVDDDTVVLRALGRVLGDLADVGYDAAWVGLRAADVGAPHGRFRVFILAWPRDADARSETGDEWAGLRKGEPAKDGRRQSARDGGSVVNLPTPRATDGTKGGPNQRGSSGDLMLPSAVAQLLPTPQTSDTNGAGEKPGEWAGRWQLRDIALERVQRETGIAASLLPTPAVNDMGAGKTVEAWDDWTDAMKERHGNGNGHGKSLSIEAQRLTVEPELLPTPKAGDADFGLPRTSGRTPEMSTHLATRIHYRDFGQYAPAIARWEAVLGREAPSPVEPTGRDGANRLSPRFTEWMMGWPNGWVTDVPGITRNEALKICGNGVVPQQCETAVRHLLAIRTAAITGESVAA